MGFVDDPSAKMSLPLPRRFGNYTLLKNLSRGGMGDVFLARRIGLEGAERLCVIKTVRTDLLAENEYVQRFVDEARLVVTLTHAGICHVFDAGRVDEVMYLAMEHIAGVTVRDVIDAMLRKNNTTIPLGHGLWILLELLDALDYAHAHVHPETGLPLRVVHRDISPQNVMVSFEGEVKLIDFGLASSGLKALQTGDDHVMGKIAYMAPEQVQGQKLDGRVDEYATAIVAYELLCGERFYGDRDNAHVTKLVASGGFRPPKMRTLPAGVYAVLDKALAPERELRYPTCGTMANALRKELALFDPMMSRGALRAWIQQNLFDELQAHRLFLRALPGGAADDTRPEHRAPGGTMRANGKRDDSESGSQKAMILEAPKTETMVRPRVGSASSNASSEDEPRTDEDKRPRGDMVRDGSTDEPATDKDFKPPDGVVEAERAARAEQAQHTQQAEHAQEAQQAQQARQQDLELDVTRTETSGKRRAPFVLGGSEGPSAAARVAPLSTAPRGVSAVATSSRAPMFFGFGVVAIAVVVVAVVYVLTRGS